MIQSAPIMLRMLRFCALTAFVFLCFLGSPALGQTDSETLINEARAAFERGVAASRAGHWEEAERAFAASRKLLVKPSTLLNLAVANVKLGRAEEALEALDAFQAIADREHHADMLERAKELRAEAERMQEAKRPVSERVRALLEPPDLNDAAQLEYARGRDAYAHGEDEDALSAFTRAYALSPASELLYDIGVVADRLRADDRAIDAFERFLAAAPNAPEAALAKKHITRLRQAQRQQATQAVAVTDSDDVPNASSSTTGLVPVFAPPAPTLTGPRAVIALGVVLSAAALGTALWWNDRHGALGDCHQPARSCENEPQISRQRWAAGALSIALGVSSLALIAGGGVWAKRRKRLVRMHGQLTGLATRTPTLQVRLSF